MKSWETKNGYKIYQVLDGRSNSYLISYKNSNVLVDTGKASAYNRLTKNIDSIELANPEISSLILTHTHFDHCQSASKLKEQKHCKIIVSDKAKEFIEEGYTPLPKGTMIMFKLLSRIGRMLGKHRFGYMTFEPDIFIKENISLEESDIHLIITEGHSSDSISIIVDNEIAIVGDAMFGIFKKSVFPPFADNIEEMVKSWGLLLNTSCKTFLPGHGKEINRELLQKEYEKYKLT